MRDSKSDPNLLALTNLDRLVHEPARLAVLSLLYVLKSADFTFVINQTGLTWGNLSAHISKLEAGGYVEAQKSFKGKRPNTTLMLTPQGRESFKVYVQNIREMLKDLPI